jgi:hypothetical protein
MVELHLHSLIFFHGVFTLFYLITIVLQHFSILDIAALKSFPPYNLCVRHVCITNRRKLTLINFVKIQQLFKG